MTTAAIIRARRLHPLAALLAIGVMIAASPAALAQREGPGLGRMQFNSSEPIAIDADRLEVRESDGVAIFTGAVEVTQGNTGMKAGRLNVHYAQGSGGSAATGTAAIERLEMFDKVVVRSATQTVTGDTGTFDMRSEVFTMTGDRVVLTEGDSVAVGCKLVVQMRTGKANLESCPSSSGRVQIMLTPRTGN